MKSIKLLTFKCLICFLIFTACENKTNTINVLNKEEDQKKIYTYIYKEINFNKKNNYKSNIKILNLDYKTLILKIRYIEDRAYIQILNQSKKIINWHLVNINYFYNNSLEMAENQIHLLVNETNLTKGYILFPSFSEEYLTYSLYRYNLKKLTYIGDYYSEFKKNGIFYYNKKYESLYTQSNEGKHKYNLLSKSDLKFSKQVTEKDIKLLRKQDTQLNNKESTKIIDVTGNYSKKYLLQLEHSLNIETEQFPTAKLTINILDKNKKVLQKISYKPKYLMGNILPNKASNIESKNFNNGIENYNKIIFGDFNFDSLEDFAFINYEGSNAGPQYTYFLQERINRFVLNNFLSKNVKFFPKKINSRDKTLTIQHPVGCCKTRKSIFKLKNNKWTAFYSIEEELKK